MLMQDSRIRRREHVKDTAVSNERRATVSMLLAECYQIFVKSKKNESTDRDHHESQRCNILLANRLSKN